MIFLLLSSITYEQQDIISDIFKEHNKYFLFIASQYKIPAAESEDAVAASYVKIIEKIDKIESLRDKSKIKAYCITIVKNTCLDILRKKKRSAPNANLDNFMPSPQVSVEDELIKGYDIATLVKLVRNLSNDEKRLLYLRYELDMGYKEISVLFDITEEAAKKRGQRIISKVRSLLEEEDLL